MRSTRLRPAVVAVLAALAVLAGPPAAAIPPANGLRRVLTAAGSDTTQGVMAAVLARHNGNFAANANPGDGRQRDNAVNLTPIPVTPGASVPGDPHCGRRIYTPGGNVDADPRTVDPINGSTAGKNALAASAGAASLAAGCIDIARSSSGRRTSDPADPRTFEFYAYARDAVSWSSFPGGQAPSSLSRQNLIDIYTCVITDWSDARLPVDGGSGQIIRILPQSGSGTLSFFTDTVLQGATIPPHSTACPLIQNAGLQENSGEAIAAQVAPPDRGRVVVPFSAAQWVAQGNATLDDDRAGMFIGSINDVDPVNDGPPPTMNSQVILDGSFIGSRLVYNVLDTRSPSYSDALRAVGFDASGPSVLCTGALAPVLREYGFVPLPLVSGNACGLY